MHTGRIAMSACLRRPPPPCAYGLAQSGATITINDSSAAGGRASRLAEPVCLGASPRFQRLRLVRGSDDERYYDQAFNRVPSTNCGEGSGAPKRIPLRQGGDEFDCRRGRMHDRAGAPLVSLGGDPTSRINGADRQWPESGYGAGDRGQGTAPCQLDPAHSFVTFCTGGGRPRQRMVMAAIDAYGVMLWVAYINTPPYADAEQRKARVTALSQGVDKRRAWRSILVNSYYTALPRHTTCQNGIVKFAALQFSAKAKRGAPERAW